MDKALFIPLTPESEALLTGVDMAGSINLHVGPIKSIAEDVEHLFET